MSTHIGIPCIKTGCELYSHEHNCTFWGDLFKLNERQWLFRYSRGSKAYLTKNDKPEDSAVQCHQIDFDDDTGDYGTMIFNGTYDEA